MSNTIQIKRRTSGSGALSALAVGELGVDLTDSNKLYVGTSGGNQLLNPSTSTSYLPLAGGTLTGDLEVQTASGGELLIDRNGNSGVLLQQKNNGADNSGSLKLQSGTSTVFTAGGTDILTLTSTGGTLTGNLTINSDNATLRQNDSTSGSNFNIFSNGSELRMAQHNATFPGAYLNLTTGGNLGLGVTGASERLVVGGNIMLTSGAILTNHSSHNNYGFQIKSNDANQSALEFKDSGNNWLGTLYAAKSGSTKYIGFLDAPWGNWDVQNKVNGALDIDQGRRLEAV